MIIVDDFYFQDKERGYLIGIISQMYVILTFENITPPLCRYEHIAIIMYTNIYIFSEGDASSCTWLVAFMALLMTHIILQWQRSQGLVTEESLDNRWRGSKDS